MSTTNEPPRLGDVFLQERGHLLSEHGFTDDPGWLERTNGAVVFYHYIRPEHQDAIMREGAGLYARIPLLTTDLTPEFDGWHEVQAFLEPRPQWLDVSSYFGDLGAEMRDARIGAALLRIELPEDSPGLHVCDFAHPLECKHATQRGSAPLNLGHDCRTGHNSVRAYMHSYVPLRQYNGGHVAPIVAAARRGEGIHFRSAHHRGATRTSVVQGLRPTPGRRVFPPTSRRPRRIHAIAVEPTAVDSEGEIAQQPVLAAISRKPPASNSNWT